MRRIRFDTENKKEGFTSGLWREHICAPISLAESQGEADCTGPAEPVRGEWVAFSGQQGAIECFTEVPKTEPCFRKMNLGLSDRWISRSIVS